MQLTYVPNQGNRAWTEHFRWEGHAAFRRAKTVDWAPSALNDHNQQGQAFRLRLRRNGGGGGFSAASSNRGGQYKSAAGLTFLTLEGAGHLAPMDQPAAALAMVRCVFLFSLPWW